MLDKFVTKITEKTMISVHIALLLMSLAIWTDRLNQRLESMEKDFKVYKDFAYETNPKLRLYLIEDKLKMPHLSREKRNENE